MAATAGGRTRQGDVDSKQRLKELIAKIEIEQNPRTFSALVEELNRLLDGGQSAKKPPTRLKLINAHLHADIGTPVRIS